MKDKYIYPALFTFYKNDIGVTFPDLPGCVSGADNIENAMRMAQEALGLHIFGMEKDNDPIPEPSDILSIQHGSNQAVVFIDVFMPRIRDAINNRAVTKAVTIPQWLLSEAREADINFSQTLQDALMQKLGIRREIKRRKYKSKRYA